MKVIFIDFDGVLNTEKYIAACGEQGMIIDPARLALLKGIVDVTGAKIVLSTSWREHWSKELSENDEIGDQINVIFSTQGLKIYDKTPQLPGRREGEIHAWLEQHPDVKKFVVLDDMFLGGDFLVGHFIKTSGYSRGLNEAVAAQAIEILGVGL